MGCWEFETISILVCHCHRYELVLLDFNIEYLLFWKSACSHNFPASRRWSVIAINSLKCSSCTWWHTKTVNWSIPTDINSEIVIDLWDISHHLLGMSDRRLQSWTVLVIRSNRAAIALGSAYHQSLLDHLVSECSRLSLISLGENICKRSLAFTILELLRQRYLLNLRRMDYWLIIQERGVVRGRPLLMSIYGAMLLLWMVVLMGGIEWLFHPSSYLMQTKPNRRFISRSGASWLLLIWSGWLLSCLQHR